MERLMTRTDNTARESTAIQQIRRRLATEGNSRPAAVEYAVDQALARFAGAPIRDYVPLLVERFARESLRRDRATTCGRVHCRPQGPTRTAPPGTCRPRMEVRGLHPWSGLAYTTNPYLSYTRRAPGAEVGAGRWVRRRVLCPRLLCVELIEDVRVALGA